MTLRVLMVAAAYFPSVGGVETHVHEVARRLHGHGIEAEVLATDLTGRLPARDVHDGVVVHRVRAYPEDRDWRFAPGLDAVIGSARWDLVHAQGYHTAVAPIALAAAWRHGIPSILTFHSGGAVSPLRGAVRGLQLLAIRPLVRHARALIAVSHFERRTLAADLHLSRERFVVIPNGNELPAPSTDLPRRDPSDIRVLSVGRLVRYKGHHRVIDAFPEVLLRYPGAHLEIIGSGPYEHELRRMVSERGLGEQVCIGAIPGSDRQAMADAMAGADLVTLLSDYESQGLAAVEALTLGRKVLVAETSALTELAAAGARTVALEAGATATAQAIIASLEAPADPPRLPPWSWDDCTSRLAGLYQQARAA